PARAPSTTSETKNSTVRLVSELGTGRENVGGHSCLPSTPSLGWTQPPAQPGPEASAWGPGPRDLDQRRSLKFRQRLLPATSRQQIAFPVCLGIHVFDQAQATSRQILREFGGIEAERVGLGGL